MDKKLPDSKGSEKEQVRPFVFVQSEVLRKPSKRLRAWLSNWPVLLGFLFLTALSGAYLFTVFPDWRHLTSVLFSPREEVPDAKLPSSSQVARPADLIGQLPTDLRKDLMSQDLQSTAEFSRSFVRPISSICDALGATGVGHFSISQNPVSGDRKVCTSDVIPIGEGTSDADTSSIFVWALGSDNEAVEMFRLKVNLTNLKSADATKAAALVILKRLHAEFGWDMPSGVERGLQEMKDATISYFGISYQLTHEWSSVPRLNIVIRPKDSSGMLPSGSFERVVGIKSIPRKPPKPGPFQAPSTRPRDASPGQSSGTQTGPIENLYR